MNKNFGFDKYDFTTIEETMRSYYPIDSQENNPKKNISDLADFDKINELITENFIVQKNYRERWVKFKNFLKQELKKPVQETMIAVFPCYSGKVILKKEGNDTLIYRKELHFYVSLLGPYYSIIGLDSTDIFLQDSSSIHTQNGLTPYTANHAITVSPYMEYQEQFTLLQAKIVEYLPSFKFIPFSICLRKMPGMPILDSFSKDPYQDSVFNALFRPDDNLSAQKRGDSFFGAEEWLKVKRLDRLAIDEINQDFAKRSELVKTQETLHKVWILESINILPTTTMMGGGAFINMDHMQVLDLSNPLCATFTTKENEVPVDTKYAITDNEIHFDGINAQEIKFLISSFMPNELKITIRLKIELESAKKFDGDVFELVYIPY